MNDLNSGLWFSSVVGRVFQASKRVTRPRGTRVMVYMLTGIAEIELWTPETLTDTLSSINAVRPEEDPRTPCRSLQLKAEAAIIKLVNVIGRILMTAPQPSSQELEDANSKF